MSEIYVEGLGNIDIAGETPTKEEIANIEKFIKENPDMINNDDFVNNEVQKHIESPSFGRIALEIGGSIAGSFLTGGLGLPLVAARLGMLSRPFLARLLQSSLGSGVGGASGSLVAETFNPTNDAYASALRAGKAAFIGEAIGGPAAIKSFNFMAKLVSPKLDKHLVAQKGEAIISGRIEAIKNFADKNGREAAIKKFGKKQVDFADDAMVTPGIAYDNRTLDILENLAEKSFLGSKVMKTKLATRGLTQEMVQEFNENLAKTAGRKGVMNPDGSLDVTYSGSDIGKILLNSLSKGKTGYESFVGEAYEQAIKKYDDGIAQIRGAGLGSELAEDVPNIFFKKVVGGKQRVFDDKIFEIAPLRKELQRFIDEDKFALGPSGVTQVANMMNFLKSVGEKMSLKDAYKFQKMINTEAAPITAANQTVINNVNAKFRLLAREALYGKKGTENIEKFKNFPLFKDFLKTIKETDEIVKIGKTYFDDDFIQKTFKDLTPNQFGFLEGNGSEVLSNVLNYNKPEMFGKVLAVLNKGVKDKVITKEVVENFKIGARSKMFNDLIESARADKMVFGREFIPATMQKNLRQRRELFEKLFTKQEMKQIDDNLTAMNTAYGKLAQEGQLPGGTAITLAQPAALQGLGAAVASGGLYADSGALTLGGVTLIAGPWAISRLFTSKAFNTYLRKGYDQLQKESAASYKAAGEGNFAGISNFRKTATATRQFMQQLLSQGLINRQELEQAEANIPKAIDNIRNQILNETNITIPQDKEQETVSPPPMRNEDGLDRALDEIGPMSNLGDTVTPQTTQPAPQPRVRPSGIASLQSRPEQLARLDQLGLSLFDRG